MPAASCRPITEPSRRKHAASGGDAKMPCLTVLITWPASAPFLEHHSFCNRERSVHTTPRIYDDHWLVSTSIQDSFGLGSL
jgi:hypothetical protein